MPEPEFADFILPDGTVLEWIGGFSYIDRKTNIVYVISKDGEILGQSVPEGFGSYDEYRIHVANELTKHGEGLFNTWANLAYQEPPADLIGRILWSAGVFSQMLISAITFPAALGAFLLEEAIQSFGMGAYILSQARHWWALEPYLERYKDFIDSVEISVKNVATFNPVTGGSVLIYVEAARASQSAFMSATMKRLLEAAMKDEESRKKLFEEQNYGSVRLTSSPSGAEIWMNGINTEKLTPETFKMIPEGDAVIELAKYDRKTEDWRVAVFTLTTEAGFKKEIHTILPDAISGEEDEEIPGSIIKEPQLPLWVTAEVEGEYAIDGDTFVTTTGEKIRIIGVDAPEIGQPWADVATDYLTNAVEDKKIILKIMGHLPIDTYGRTLAVCKNYKGNIGIMLLSAGLARNILTKDDIEDPTRYIAAEENARARKVGIWSGT